MLEEYIRYSCQVAAATSVGVGPYTDPTEITTLQSGKSRFNRESWLASYYIVSFLCLIIIQLFNTSMYIQCRQDHLSH